VNFEGAAHLPQIPRHLLELRTRTFVSGHGRFLADRGYQATTIREICAEAGANGTSANYHFDYKFGLYAEVLRRPVRAAQLKAVHNALDQSTPPKDVFRAATWIPILNRGWIARYNRTE
jgi:AcrR family transcriptional regulator